MKPDPEYTKLLLEALQAAASPWPRISDIQDAGIEVDGELAFHLELLADDGFLESLDGDGGFGIAPGIGEHEWSYQDVRMRLTAQGHSFLEILETEDVWSTVKRDFKDASFETLYKVGRSMIETYAKRKVNAYVDQNAV